MENTKPFFSLIIPTLNEELTLPQLLADLIKQTFTDFEVIVVDGQSDDRTVTKIRTFEKKFKRLQIIISDKRGVQYQRNLGSKKAKTDWLIFIDADNRIPHFFLQGIKFKTEMLNPDILATWILPDSHNRTDKAASLLSNFFVDIQKSSSNPFLFESMLCIKKKSFLKLKGFNTNLKVGEGSDLLKRAHKLGMTFSFVKEPKYVCSFRRVRKLGHLKLLRSMVEIELARLTNRSISKQKVDKLYPMEGGGYFELDQNARSSLKKIFSKFFLNSPYHKR